MASGKLSAKCEMRSAKCEVTMPDTSQNGKWEMASGKFRNCVAIIKMTDASSQMTEALQEVKLKYLR